MNNQASTSRYILTALAIILVITAFVLVGLNALNIGDSFNPLAGASQAELNESYKAGYLAAREKYLGPPMEDQRSTVATVLSNSGNTLIVNVTGLDTDPVVDGVGQQRTIQVGAATVIQSATPKTPEQLNAELLASPEKPPEPETYTVIRLQDIPVGAQVRIRSAESLRLLETIPATEVTLLP